MTSIQTTGSDGRLK